MALNKSRMALRDSKPDRPTRSGLTAEDSAVSFGDNVLEGKPLVRYAWAPGNDKVNSEQFHRMSEDYRQAKKRELALEQKAKQLAAQLARTEEAAKRALVETDATARGGAAQKLLDAERAIAKLRDENAELRSKLARERKRAADLKTAYDETRKRLDTTLKDQRTIVRKVGDLERQTQRLPRRAEDDFWSEEAGRRFAAQQEELVALREDNMRLHQMLEHGGMAAGATGGADPSNPSPEVTALQAQVEELSGLVNFYERKMATLAEQHLIPAQEGMATGPSPEDWILEEHYHDDQLYLLDRKTGKLFTAATATSWPRPVGTRTGTQVKLGSNSPMERFINTLDNYLKAQHAQLEAVFKEFDLDGSGLLDRRELARLVKRLMPELTDSRQVEELGAMLDMDGDGQVSFSELLGTIKEAYAARMAAKAGKSPELNSQLERIRDVIKEQKKMMREAFDALDTDQDGCLHHLDVVQLLRKFVKDLAQREVRYLLARLQEWDLTGEGKTTWGELLQALELVQIYRVGQGMGGKAVPLSPGRSTATAAGAGGGTLAGTRHTTTTLSHTSTLGGAGARTVDLRKSIAPAQGLKEGFLRERLAQLEAELTSAQRRESALEADAGRVEVLRRDLALARARIEDLEKDYSKLDILFRVESTAMSGDHALHSAWETAAQFKKRYMEHKAELDSIRLAAARMQAQLDETHKLLHAEHKKRFALEDDVSRLTLEVSRVKDLENRLSLERTERVKLEKEYLTLQSKALSAPSNALGEVRQLRDELFALRRDKALAEHKEAEVRRELSHVREQLDGMSIEQYRAWQREYQELKKKVATLTLELQAANDKLDVYRRTDTPGVSGIVFGNKEAPTFLDRRPDVDKNEDEVRRELAQLREVWHSDQLELKKLHHVLEAESGQTLEAKAALEEAHREMDRVRRDLQDQLRSLQRETDRRDERIRKLELQLRGAYSGINRALRCSRLRDSRTTDSPDDLSDLGDDQNLLELHVSEATLFEEMLGKDPSTFFTYDFFMHDTQATPVLASNTPNYDTLVQYVVDADTFLVQYLDTHVLELELNRARGWDYDAVGVARIPLRQVLEDVEIGAALGHNRAYHYADVFGADGKRIGRVRYGFAFRKPLDNLLRDYRMSSRSKRPSDPDARDPAAMAVVLAQNTPAAASHVKVVVARCEHLVSPSNAGPASRPYVWFRFPGHRDPHSTRMLHGAHPTYNDESTWLLASMKGRAVPGVSRAPWSVSRQRCKAEEERHRSPDLEHNFKTREMEFVVFDDAGGEDPLRGIVGVAFVPLAALAQGVPVEGAFKLINPVTKKEAGKIVLGMGWHNPLSLPSANPPQKAPATTALAAPPASAQQSPAVLYGAAGPAGPSVGAGAGSRQGSPGADPAQYGVAAEAGRGAAALAGLPQFPAPPARQPPPQPGYGLASESPQQQGLAAQLPVFPGRAVDPATPGAGGGYGLAAEQPAAQQQQAPGRFVPPRVPADRFDLATSTVPSSTYGYTAVGVPGQPPQQQQGAGDYGLASEASFAVPQPAYSQSPPVPQHVLLPGAGAQAAGRARYASEVDRSMSPPPLQGGALQGYAGALPPAAAAPLFSVLPVPSDPAYWPPRDTHVVVALDALQLDSTSHIPQGFSHLFVMHALLEGSVQRLEDTCTQLVAARPGPLMLNYAVAYRVVGSGPGDTSAGQATTELLARLAQGAFLDLRVFASHSPVLDLGQLQTGGVVSLAVADVSLNEIATGRQQDLIKTQLTLCLEKTNQRVGTITVTLLAAAALRAAQQQAGGAGWAPVPAAPTQYTPQGPPQPVMGGGYPTQLPPQQPQQGYGGGVGGVGHAPAQGYGLF